MRPLLTTLLLVLACGCSVPPAAPPPSFAEALWVHLDAIRAHDLDALTPTLTTRDSLVLIFPDGSMVRSRETFLDIHREWFADDSWRIDFEVLDTTETDRMAVATLRWTLTDDTPRSGRQALLSLTFALEAGEWRLVHDQNTGLPFGEG